MAFDTSTEKCSAAIFQDGCTVLELNLPGERSHSQMLFPLWERLFQETGLRVEQTDLVAVGTGPGSFTGIRIGLSAANGLAMALKKPLLGVIGLKAIAAQAGQENRLVCPMLDARRREVYACIYRMVSEGHLEAITDYYPWPLESLQEKIIEYDEQIILAGSGARIYKQFFEDKLADHISFSEPDSDFPHAGTIAMLAWRDWQKNNAISNSSVKPVYLRKSEAEVRWEAIRGGHSD